MRIENEYSRWVACDIHLRKRAPLNSSHPLCFIFANIIYPLIGNWSWESSTFHLPRNFRVNRNSTSRDQSLTCWSFYTGYGSPKKASQYNCLFTHNARRHTCDVLTSYLTPDFNWIVESNSIASNQYLPPHQQDKKKKDLQELANKRRGPSAASADNRLCRYWEISAQKEVWKKLTTHF